MEKKIAALESERQSFGRNKALSVNKLASVLYTINGNKELIARMKKDWDVFNNHLQYDKEGNKLNPVKLDGIESYDIKIIADKLTKLNDSATTHGEYYRICELYGFRLLIKTKDSMKEGLFMKENRFFIEGESNLYNLYKLIAQIVLRVGFGLAFWKTASRIFQFVHT
ncbi:MAG: hypothetical protein LBP63_09530 [Prevotellaceae bacterium]|jgi:hypothetical protein|nr:hypothetical protein [Prevotellaceae bacterium]